MALTKATGLRCACSSADGVTVAGKNGTGARWTIAGVVGWGAGTMVLVAPKVAVTGDEVSSVDG